MQRSSLLILCVLFLVTLVITVLFASCRSETGGADGSAALTFDSFDGGGPEYTVTVSDPSVLSYESERKYDKPNHEQLDGASYSVIFTFRGVKSGKTTVTISARSPIADNYDVTYMALVDDALNVKLTKLTEVSEKNPLEPVPALIMVVNDNTFYPQLENTPAADALVEKLSQEAIELHLHDYGNYEKTDELPWLLPQNDETLTTQAGDILLYNGNQICLCYDENTSKFTRLAKLDDISRENLLKLFGVGDVTVQLWVEWSE